MTNQTVSEIEPRLLRVREASKIAGVCLSRGYEYAANGTWPVVRLGRSIRVPARALERWLAQLEQEAGVSECEEALS